MCVGFGGGRGWGRVRGGVDCLVRGFNGLFRAIPNFFLATLIVLTAGLYFPSVGIFNYVPFAQDPWANLGSMLLPALSLALAVSVTISENTRAAVLEGASQDFVMVARAKGLRRDSVLVHYLIRKALTAGVTRPGLQPAPRRGGRMPN